MIELYFWPTPNGLKVSVFLEEAGLEYRVIPINIEKGDQFGPEFLEIAPNNRIPAIVDHTPSGGGEPVTVFESGAILMYLAEKTGRFLPKDNRLRVQAIEWLMWQMGGLGPMLGQNHHFNRYAPEEVPYAVRRYTNETLRLYAVLDRRLQGREFIAEEYSIADMAVHPWVSRYEWHKTDIDRFPQVKRWYEGIFLRSAVRIAHQQAEQIETGTIDSDDSRQVLFGQSDATLKKAYGKALGSD
jgi:GST-like protein